MLGDDEDVFDSVTWEAPSKNPYDAENVDTPSGPGFRQSTAEDGQGTTRSRVDAMPSVTKPPASNPYSDIRKKLR
jgi:hypothetical protein